MNGYDNSPDVVLDDEDEDVEDLDAAAQYTRQMKIYLVRHGQTDWNLRGIVQGRKGRELLDFFEHAVVDQNRMVEK